MTSNIRKEGENSFFRYGLKVLLIVVTTVALSLGWASRNARRQATAVAEINNCGGSAEYNGSRHSTTSIGRLIGRDYFQDVVYVTAEGSQVDDSIAHSISHLTATKSLSLRNAQIGDASIECLSSLRDLKHLDLMHTLVTDDCVSALSKMNELRFVDLRGTKVTKAGVERLHALNRELEIRHHSLSE